MVKIELGKGDFIWIGLIVVLLGVSFGYAFGGSEPAVMGHSGGELDISDLALGGTNSWILHTPDDGRTGLWIAPKVSGVWDWARAITVDNGDVCTSTNCLNDALNQNSCQWIYISTCGHSCPAQGYYQAVCPVGYYMAGHSMYTWASYATYNHRIYCCAA